MFWILLTILLSSPGHAAPVGEDSPCDVDSGQEARSEKEALEYARKLYVSGCHVEALQLFRVLDTRYADAPASGTHLKALSFLGEVQYKLGDREASMATFQRILRLEPDYQISVLDHDPGAVSLFNLAKVVAAQEQPKPVSTAPTKGLPATMYLPLGVPQFNKGRPVLGAVYSTLQIASAATSIGVFIYMNKRWTAPFRKRDATQANMLRFGVQWPAPLLFWGTYLASHFQARNQWRRDHSPNKRVRLQIGVGREFISASIRLDVL